MQNRFAFNVWYAIAAMVGVLLLQGLWVQWRDTEPLAYSEFLAQLRAGNVAELAVSANAVRGVLRQPLPDGRKAFVATRVEPELAAELERSGVKFTGVVESTLLRDALGWILPTVLFVGIWMFVIRRMQSKDGFGALGGGLMSIGKSKAKVFVEKGVRVGFDDVAGVDEAKDELREIVAFLKDPAGYGRLGARMPRGILLVGPPGTGKTLLARAVAGEAGVPFFSINGSEFVEMFVGVGAARVRDLFDEARRQAPAIIFIDEIDALGRARGVYGGFGGHDEKEQTLNQLLAELDGFDSSGGLVLLAATNRPEILDPALLRAGRFDRQVLVDRPDRKGRVQVLQVHVRRVRLAAGTDLETIAALTPGFTGADLANLVNEAALHATRAARDDVGLDDFTAAIERLVAGLEKRNRLLNPREREVVAHHEMGHALVAMALPGQDPVQKVSIIPRGVGALGYTLQRPTEDRFLMTREELIDRMAVLLGGRVAETLAFGEVSTGAADDLAKVTDIARSMVTRYGMDEQLGNLVFEAPQNRFLGPEFQQQAPRPYSEATARRIDEAAKALVDMALARAGRVLQARRAELLEGARLLLERETLDAAQVRALAQAGSASAASAVGASSVAAAGAAAAAAAASSATAPPNG